ncbi:MAG TPA: FkbM family methyltransferase [Methylocella sp.]|nr:FkbM family methyltransferase [Methylocella sp.]
MTAFTLAQLVSRTMLTISLCRKIGVRPGVLLGMALPKRNPRENAKLVRVTMPGFAPPIYLRAGTSDMYTFLHVIMDPEYDIRSYPQFQKLNDIYQKSIAEGHRPLIIDCGANIGLSAIWFSHMFPEAKIFAVEPDGDNIEVAQRNLAAYPNVTVLHGAIWDRPENLTIADTSAAPWAYQTKEAPDGAARSPDTILKAFTISQIMEMADTSSALIVKVDIEGAEASLFRSNIEWVGLTDLIAIELHDWLLPKQRTSAPFVRSFANLDFDLLQKGENLFVFLDRPAA